MNASNAVIFALVGAAMELLPRLFPSWFPPSGGDQSSGRALWLGVMGALQFGLGFGYIVRLQIVPLAMRLLSAMPAGERGSLALPNPRGVTGR